MKDILFFFIECVADVVHVPSSVGHGFGCYVDFP
jgi:hypothetical protein